MHRYISEKPIWITSEQANGVRDAVIVLPNGADARVLTVRSEEGFATPYALSGFLGMIYLTQRAVDEILVGRCDLRDPPRLSTRLPILPDECDSP